MWALDSEASCAVPNTQVGPTLSLTVNSELQSGGMDSVTHRSEKETWWRRVITKPDEGTIVLTGGN